MADDSPSHETERRPPQLSQRDYQSAETPPIPALETVQEKNRLKNRKNINRNRSHVPTQYVGLLQNELPFFLLRQNTSAGSTCLI